MRNVRKGISKQPNIGAPLALLLVALLVVVHPASQLLCVFMPCGVLAAEHAKQPVRACCRKDKASQPTTASCCKKKQAASDCNPLPDNSRPDTACCGDARNHNYVSGKTLRLAPKFSHWQHVSYPLVAVLLPSMPDVAPKVIRHTLRDGPSSPPASPFLRPVLGRAPPELA